MPFVNNQGVRIHYQVEGQGPPLVLLPGYSMTCEDWRELATSPDSESTTR